MKIPLFPLDVVLFPGAALPLHIFEPRYKDLTQYCLQHAMEFGVVRAWRDGLAVIGCTASILSVLHRYPDGRLDILCRGEWRFEVESLDDSSSYLQAEVDVFEDVEDASAISTREQREQCAALHMEMLQLSGSEAREFPHVDLDRPVAFLLAASIPSDLKFKQELLRERSDATRTSRLVEFYHAILPKLRRGAMVSSAARSNGHVM